MVFEKIITSIFALDARIQYLFDLVVVKLNRRFGWSKAAIQLAVGIFSLVSLALMSLGTLAFVSSTEVVIIAIMTMFLGSMFYKLFWLTYKTDCRRAENGITAHQFVMMRRQTIIAIVCKFILLRCSVKYCGEFISELFVPLSSSLSQHRNVLLIEASSAMMFASFFAMAYLFSVPPLPPRPKEKAKILVPALNEG